MRVFVTGATGYVGGAVVNALVTSGHAVYGLVRSEDAAATLDHLGGEPVLGDLLHPDSYRWVAGEQDAIVHIGRVRGAEAADADRVAIETLLEAARRGRCGRFIYTSGVWVLGDTGPSPATEEAPTARPAAVASFRPAHERMVLEGGDDRLATAVIRPGLVYGGSGGLVSRLFRSARAEGAAAYIGGGRNRWSVVYRDDVAELYRQVAERRARGIFHGVDGTPLPALEIARAASTAAGAGGRIRAVPLDEARAELGAMADALCLDQGVIAPRARALGWAPTRESFVEGALDAYQEWRRPGTEPDYAERHPRHWNIGRPQRALVRLQLEGRIEGQVLEVGCGTGDNALFLAARGHRVSGCDLDSGAIARAREKAAERGLEADFFLEDVLDLEQTDRRVDTILDFVDFHLFRGDDRRRYVDNLRSVLRPGGRLIVLGVPEPGPGLSEKWRLSAGEILAALQDGWELVSMEEDLFEHFPSIRGSPAIAATFRRS